MKKIMNCQEIMQQNLVENVKQMMYTYKKEQRALRKDPIIGELNEGLIAEKHANSGEKETQIKMMMKKKKIKIIR